MFQNNKAFRWVLKVLSFHKYLSAGTKSPSHSAFAASDAKSSREDLGRTGTIRNIRRRNWLNFPRREDSVHSVIERARSATANCKYCAVWSRHPF